jgi:SAM-dependent methyltransferase
LLQQDVQMEKAYWEIVAKDYERKEISPLMKGIRNPLYKYVQELDARLQRRAVDLGCGTGELLPYLAENFDFVLGIDWSANMLHRAKEIATRYKNIRLLQMDARSLSILKIQFDVVFSINSINFPDDFVIELILKEIFKSLRWNGLFIAIFPAIDTVIHQRVLTIKGLIQTGYSEREAIHEADSYFVDRNKLDKNRQLYADNGVHLQRFFDLNEIKFFIQHKANLSLVQAQKVFYPWEIAKQYGYGYFPGEEEIWDWFVVARK